MFAFRSEVPTKTFCLFSLRLSSLFLICLWCAVAVLIAVSHQLIAPCISSISAVFVVILPLFFYYLLFTVTFYIFYVFIYVVIFSFSLVHFLNPDFSLNGLEKKNLAHFKGAVKGAALLCSHTLVNVFSLFLQSFFSLLKTLFFKKAGQ